MNKFRFYCLASVLVLFSLLKVGCTISLYNSSSLANNNWIIDTNGTKTGIELSNRLKPLNNKEGEIYNLGVEDEKIVKRVIGVDENGSPTTYLQELAVNLIVKSDDKIILQEPIFKVRQLSYKEQSDIVSQQQEQMYIEMVNDIMLRLSEVVNSEGERKLMSSTSTNN